MEDEIFNKTTLDAIADFRNGKAISPDKYSEYGKYPVYGANGQIARSDDVLNEEAVVVIGRVGAYCGSVYYIPEPSWVTDNAIIATAKPGHDVRFLYYLLGFLELRRTAIGSAQPLMTQGGLKVVQTLVPPLKEQQAIACILGALDDKIELNRRMNKTLEDMARAIFKSWFVDFDPVRIKAAGQRPPGLKPEIAALFPDSFEDSELGEIPKGWGINSLDKIGTFLNGLALQKYPPSNDTSLPAIKIAQLRKGNTEGADKAGGEIDPAYIIRDGDVLFSWSGSLECVIWTGGRGALNQHLFKVSSEHYPKWFYYFWIHHHLPEFRRIAEGKATTMGHIQRYHLTQAIVIIPPKPIFSRADKFIGPILDGIIINALECNCLSRLRDILLPMLISGELRMPDVERIIRRYI